MFVSLTFLVIDHCLVSVKLYFVFFKQDVVLDSGYCSVLIQFNSFWQELERFACFPASAAHALEKKIANLPRERLLR